MKIATWNVNSILARLPLVLQWLQTVKPDVLCLQETKCTDAKFPFAELAEIGYQAVTHGQPSYNGVAILTREAVADLQRGMPDDEPEAQARVIVATLGDVRIVNVYVPNGNSVGADKYYFKLDWLRRLRLYFDAAFKAEEKVLLCGDLNIAPDDRDVYDPLRWAGKILCSAPERAALDEILAWGLTDAFRLYTQAGGFYSWWDYRSAGFARNEGLRIDHICITASLAATCRGVLIDKKPRGWERPSDHTPVIAMFR